MSHEERNVVTELLTNLVIVALFVWALTNGFARGDFAGPDAPRLWAVLVLKLIVASIMIGILLSIALAIGWRIFTGESPDLTRDERDRSIAGMGWKYTALGTAAGFVAGIIALALGWSVIAVLNLMLAGCALGDTAGNLAKLRAYRAGA